MKKTSKITKIGFCHVCGTGFEKIGRGQGTKIYCSVCSFNKQREKYHRYDSKRPKRNDKISEYMRKGRALGTVADNRNDLGNDCVGKPPEKNGDEITDDEWNAYHNKIKKLKRLTIGGYQEYHEVE